MWHEARRQERLIRGLLVDYLRRAERRKDFYEKIKADPTQFLQLHGRRSKIHLDPAVAAAGDSPAIMMPWQGDTNNLIDRFDVRAHLDLIPEVRNPDIPVEELSHEERLLNYERYRILAQNTFLAIGEDKFLQQLAIEEQFGVTIEEKEAQKEKLHEKKATGVAIGYNYNEPGAPQPATSAGTEVSKPPPQQDEKDSDEDSDLEIIDVDLSIDVNKVEPAQAHELNAVGPSFGMAGCDLFSFLTGDADDAELQKQRMREEKEKAMFSGRKSRRERRAHRDKKLATRVLSPPSYAAPSANGPREESKSPSRSPSPYKSESIQFITSFGGDDEESKLPVPKPLYADKVKKNMASVDTSYSAAVRGKLMSARRSPLRSPERYRHRSPARMGPHRPYSRSSSSSRSRSRSRSCSRGVRSRSRSSSYGPRYRRSRSRSRSYGRRNRTRSRSPQNQSSSYAKHTTRSMSDDRSEQKKSPIKPAPAPVVPRYYGRRKDDKQSSSEISLDSDSSDGENDPSNKNAVGVKLSTNQNHLRLTGSSTKGGLRAEGAGAGGPSLKDKLRRKMQAQLSRQLRADKRAEAERLERENQLQAQRDEEMRELAIKLRRRHREMRHQRERRSSDSDSDRSYSSRRSSDRGSPECDIDKKLDKNDSRSDSSSPELKKIPVWERGFPMGPEKASYSNQPPVPGTLSRLYGGDEADDRTYRSNDYSNKDTSYRHEETSGERRPYKRFEGQRPYSRPDLGRPPPNPMDYDDSWEREVPSFRGRGSFRRPHGGNRGGYRGQNSCDMQKYGGNSGASDVGRGEVRNYNSGRSEGGNYNSGRSEGGNYHSGRSEGGNYNSGRSEGGNYHSGRSEGGNYNSGRSEGGNYNSGRSEGGNNNSGRSEGGNYNSGRSEGGNYNPGRSEGGNYNSSRSEGANYNSGRSESGNYNSGQNEGGSYNSGRNEAGTGRKDTSYKDVVGYNSGKKDHHGESYNSGRKDQNSMGYRGYDRQHQNERHDSRRGDSGPPSKARKLVDY